MAQDPIVTLLIIYLTTPQTDFYLPKLLGSIKNPALEPFRTKSIDLGRQDVLGLSLDIALTDVDIAGITNCQIAKTNGKPNVTVNGSVVTFDAIRPNTEAPPPNVPANLQLTAGFVLTPQGSPPLPPGSIGIVIHQATITGKFDATTQDGTMATVNVRFKSIGVKAALGTNMVITVNIKSDFEGIINSIVNTNNVQQQLLDQVNQALNGASVLAALSQEATSAARKAFADLGK